MRCISPLQRPHYFTSSYIYQFFEKVNLYFFKIKDCLSFISFPIHHTEGAAVIFVGLHVSYL